jgi:hypothetical protein
MRVLPPGGWQSQIPIFNFGNGDFSYQWSLSDTIYIWMKMEYSTSPVLRRIRPTEHRASSLWIPRTTSLNDFSVVRGRNTLRKQRYSTSPVLRRILPKEHQASSRWIPRTSSHIDFSVARVRNTLRKQRNTYFTCVATNSDHRTSSFFPVDSSNIASE